RVANATDPSRILIGGKAAQITAETVNPDGTTTFTIQVPTTVVLGTISCPAGGTAQVPTAVDVQYTSLLSTCTDTFPGGLTATPPTGPVFTLAPQTFGL